MCKITFSVLPDLAFGETVHAAPAHLLNKTATVSYTITIPATSNGGRSQITSRNSTHVIYISSQGRIFDRVARRSRVGAKDMDLAPNRGAGDLAFRGDTIVGVLSAISGAGQLSLSFDSSGSSCTASVIMGAEGGRVITWKALDGQIYTATGKPSVSGVSCAVSAGNGLAG